jgi:hypothetical protein
VIIQELFIVQSASNSMVCGKLPGSCTVDTVCYMVSRGSVCVNDELDIVRNKQVVISIVPPNLVGLCQVKWTCLY